MRDIDTGPGAPRRRRTVLGLAAVAASAALALSACGALGSTDSPSGGNGSVEKSRVRVTVMSAVDVAPLHLAVQEGYFKAQGLDLEITEVPSGQASLQKLLGGDTDIAFSSYVPFIAAESKGGADIKLVADADSLATRSTEIMTMPNSSVKGVKDLVGKKIAVTAVNTASDMLVKSVMKDAGLDYGSVQWISLGFPQMIPALQRGDVDAAFLAEPFVTQAARSIGAVPVQDLSSGSTTSLPLTGYGAMAKFVAANPKTVAAFQRAMKKATDESGDRAKIDPLIAQFGQVDQDTATLSTRMAYGTALDARRIQRVADLMQEMGIISGHLDIAPMIADQAATT